MLLDVMEVEEHVITREVYASARGHTELRAANLATRGVGTDLSENNTGFFHYLSIIVPFDYKFCYADVPPAIFCMNTT